MPQLSRVHLVPLQESAARILETKNLEAEPSALARELLVAFHDVCRRYGLDGLLAELDLTDDADTAEHPDLRAGLATKLSNKAEFDPRGPRNAKPAQLAQCLLGALGVELVEPADRKIPLGGAVRTEVAAALSRAIEPAFSGTTLRDAIIAQARPRIVEEHHVGFEKLVAQLDDTGTKFIKQPKVSIDIVQATQQLLHEARLAVIDRALNPAIDRAKEVLARASTEAAERIDQPITRALTPRQVTIARVADARASKLPAHVTHAVLEGLTELADLAWQVAEKPTRPYSASQSFAVGELIEHPKLGKGTVVAVMMGGKMEVEFEQGKSTLVHGRK